MVTDPDPRTGLELARDYWFDEVRAVLDRHAPDVPRAAARVGTGSDVLGLDDVMSRDHDWGLRLQVLVPEQHVARVAEVLDAHLPDEYAGLPTRFAFTGTDEPVLALDVSGLDAFLDHHLGFDPRRATLTDWLSLTGQAALEVTAGDVFEDGIGLTEVRKALVHPEAVRTYVVGSDWVRLDQELPLMSRAGDRGDELSSRVIAARLVDVATHLAFTLSRAWAPYPKWRGTMLARLPVAAELSPHLVPTLDAPDWRARQDALARALSVLARLQADEGLPSADPVTVPFWDRPYLQVEPSLIRSLDAAIGDPEVAALALGLGSAEQRTDNVDLLTSPPRRRALVTPSPAYGSVSGHGD